MVGEKIYSCRVRLQSGQEENLFVHAETEEEAKFALTSDPHVEVINVLPFLGFDKVMGRGTSSPRLLINAAGFKRWAESSVGGYKGLDVADKVKELIESRVVG
jgi:hypothetical protein